MTYTKHDPAAQMPARSYAFLSVAAALITIILKSAAYLLTGSVGLLSDALESLANLVAALVAVWALTLASLLTKALHLSRIQNVRKVERSVFKYGNRFLMIPLLQLGLGRFMSSPATGYFLLLQTTDRKSRQPRLTPLNYAIDNGCVKRILSKKATRAAALCAAALCAAAIGGTVMRADRPVAAWLIAGPFRFTDN